MLHTGATDKRQLVGTPNCESATDKKAQAETRLENGFLVLELGRRRFRGKEKAV